MQKDPRYENRRLLDLCHGAACVLNFAGCTGGTNPDEPSVPCHSDWLEDGKGVGYKAHDHTAVPGCPSCHRMLDTEGLPTEYRKRFFRAGQQRWWAYLWQNNLVKVA